LSWKRLEVVRKYEKWILCLTGGAVRGVSVSCFCCCCVYVCVCVYVSVSMVSVSDTMLGTIRQGVG